MKYIVIVIVVVAGIWGISKWLQGAPVAQAPAIETPSTSGGEQAPTEKAEVSGTPTAAAPVNTQTIPPTKATTRTIKTKNGMNIVVTKEGEGVAIANGQTAVVEYTGKLTDGTVFDASSRHGQDFSFPLGAGRVIKGWDQGVVGMKVGESRTLTIPPELAYGPNGVPGAIPPNAILVFDVTLKAIQ